jgi:hypothetical protein
VPPPGQSRWMDHFSLKRNAGGGTTHSHCFSLPPSGLPRRG